MAWIIVSYVAAILTTVAFVPQVIKIFKTKNTCDISLYMYIGFVIGVFCWVAYGIHIKELTIVLANGLTGLLALIILIFKIVNVVKGEKP